jgi:uncharacterized protein YqgC (DUF456 family)
MKLAITALVVIGIALSLYAGLHAGFDATSVALVALIAAVGILAVAVVRKWESGTIGPGKCASCGGLISPNAPLCKHCGGATNR